MRLALLGLLLLQAADHYKQGMQALEAENYDLASQMFSKAVEADTTDYAARFHLALSYSFLNRDTEAIEQYRKVLELKPGLYEAELNLGIVLLRQKAAAEAVPHLQGAIEKKPKEFRPQIYLAEALLASSEFPRAEEHFRLSSEIDPKSAAAWLGLGRAMARQNRLADAAPHFRKAAELDASFKDVLLELASLFEGQGENGEAISIYKQFPDNIAAQERLGELLIDAKRYGEAIPGLEKIVAADPTTANRLSLANAYRLDKQPEKSIPLLEAVVQAEPQRYDLRMILGRVQRDQKRYAPAAQQFLAAARLKADSVEAWNELAGMLIVLENFPQAVAALDRVKTLGGETPGTHYFRAIILDRMKQYQPALESYQTFLEGSQGQNPEEEFKARQRIRVIQKELSKR